MWRQPPNGSKPCWVREIIRSPNRTDLKLGGGMIFLAPVASGDGVNPPPVTPHQGLDHFGLAVEDIDLTWLLVSRPRA